MTTVKNNTKLRWLLVGCAVAAGCVAEPIWVGCVTECETSTTESCETLTGDTSTSRATETTGDSPTEDDTTCRR